MTQNDIFNLSNQKLYKFEFYTGQILYGFIIEDYTNDKFYLVTNKKLKEYRESKLTEEEYIKKGIYKLINIETIEHWEEQK